MRSNYQLSNSTLLYSVCLLSCFLMPVENISASDPPITAISFSPDHKSVYAAQDHKVKIYQYPTLKLKRTFEVPFSKIHDLQFSSETQLLAIAGGNPGELGVVHVRECETLNVLNNLTFQTDSIFSFSWLKNSPGFVTGSIDGDVSRYELTQKKSIRQFRGHSKGIVAARFIENDTLLVTGSIDQSLRVWDVETGENLRTLNNHTGAIHDLTLSPQKNGLPVIASVASDRTVRFWQPTIGRMVRFVKLDSIPLAVQWHPSRPVVVVTTSAGTTCLIDYETASLIGEMSAQRTWLHALAISPDGEFAVVQGDAGLQKISLSLTGESIE